MFFFFRFSENNLEILKSLPIFAAKTEDMRIISKSTLVNYYTKVPQSKTALEEWYEKTKKSEWTCFADIKNTFNSVDAVGISGMYSILKATIFD